MKRLLILCILLSSMAVFVQAADAPDLTVVQRMRIVLDMMQDGDVATPAAYAQVDQINAATGLKYVDPLIWAYRPSYRDQIDTLTNEQKAAIMLNIFRKIFLDAKRAMDASVASDVARQQAIDAVEAAKIELGADETEPPE